MFLIRGTCVSTLILLALVAGSPASAAPETYKIDGDHSMVIFKVGHLGVSHTYGRFTDIAGGFTFDAENPAGSSFDATIKTESIDTHQEKRDQHLRSPDFFNAKQFPAITLKSKSVKKTGERRYQVTADLSLHGKTQPVTFEVQEIGSGKDPWGGFRRGFDAELKIKRSQFDMTFMPEGVGDDITLLVAIEGIRQ